jgi:hypothetical protein
MGISIRFKSDNFTSLYKSYEELINLKNFNEIIYINCVNNNISLIPVLPTELQKFYCSDNHLDKLPKLPNTITHMTCYNNNLTKLPELPESLITLSCEKNNIFSLPSLPKNLKHLYCYNNKLDVLPILPQSLRSLYCYNNYIKVLPEYINNITYLYCNNNLLNNIPYTAKYIKIIRHKKNPIEKRLKKYFDNDIDKYLYFQTKVLTIFVNKIENWFLEIKYNPQYKYCKNRLKKEYDELYNDY